MPPLHVAVTTDDVTSETSVWGIWPTKGLDLFRMQKVGKMLNCVLSLWQQYPGRHRWMIHTIYWTYLYALCFTSRRQSQDTRYDECYCLEPCRVAAWKGRCCRFSVWSLCRCRWSPGSSSLCSPSFSSSSTCVATSCRPPEISSV